MNPPDILGSQQRIGRFAAALRPESVTEAQRRRCMATLIDTFSVALAGVNEPASQAAYRTYAAHAVYASCDALHAHASREWSRGLRLSAEDAALLNGITGHALDYDDVMPLQRGHPSVVLWPALLALGETCGAHGARAVSAYLAGFEVLAKLSRAVATRQYADGWHTTATLGVLGATAACAHLLALDERQTAHALGLAVAQAAGCRANVGSHAKAFQAGFAASAAVRSARLAQAGFEASHDALDGALGYAGLYAAGHPLAQALNELDSRTLNEIERAGVDVKQYPMCYATHRVLDAVLTLRRAHDVSLAQVERVEIETSFQALTPLIHHRPNTGLQGKFSLEYGVAAALQDGAVNFASFMDAAVSRAPIQAFLPQVHARDVQGPLSPRWADVSLILRRGVTLRARVEVLHGSASDTLSDAQLRGKAADCLAFGGSALGAATLVEAVTHMHESTVPALLDRLVPPPAALTP